MTAKVIGIVVTYHPDLNVLRDLLDALLPQLSKIVVVDNASSINIEAWLKEYADERVFLIPLGDNIGVAAAQNAGVLWARDSGAQFIVLFDQDSIAGIGMIRELLEVFELLTNEGKLVAGVGCRYSEDAESRLSGFVQFGHLGFKHVVCDAASRYVEADFLISSGTLIPMSTLDAVGDMEEDLFIDHVDTEWFLRARARGYLAYGASRAVMKHALGERRSKLWLFRWRTVSHHAPVRYYYMFRNAVLLFDRDYVTKRWRRGAVLKLGLTMLFICCSASSLSKIRMMVRGLRDGLRGVRGPFYG